MKNKSILLIEPSYFVAKLIRKWLSGYQVTWAPRMEFAEEALNTRRFGMTLTSLDLPDSRGLSTFYHLQQLVPSMPVVAMGEVQTRDLRQVPGAMKKSDISEGMVLDAVRRVLGPAAEETRDPELIAG